MNICCWKGRSNNISQKVFTHPLLFHFQWKELQKKWKIFLFQLLLSERRLTQQDDD